MGNVFDLFWSIYPRLFITILKLCIKAIFCSFILSKPYNVILVVKSIKNINSS
ncbi:hypothetical protein LDVICp048 [lymphocystis disease virus-China]|uniref:Uncharacterized protein n=1 Tax=lymphocystis disease virus-China TaxID=256729 RepID=Q678G3_9VIRU|nr:hypothetical protein LDVICp048 [lymphocystis disease virus-China]AAU10894.1 hypothetical protein [lymphocystis disease virus-China]